MDPLTSDQERAITQCMLKWEACEMCAYRYCGRASFDRRFCTEQTAEAKEGSQKVEKHCPLCFGALEHYASDEFVSELQKQFNEQQYEVTDFQVAISSPGSTQLREHAYWLHLVKELERMSYEDQACLSTLSMILNEDRQDFVVPLKYAWRAALCRKLETALGTESAQNSPFVIQLNMYYKKSDEECRFLELLHPAIFRRQKATGNSASNSRDDCSYLSRNCVQDALKLTHEADILEQFETVSKRVDPASLRHEVTMTHEPIAFGGRYLKLSRQLSQTPWLVNGERRCVSSVEELVCEALRKAARASAYRFSAAGREDCDVRMLGDGRPFAVQLIDPHRTRFDAAAFRQLEDEINQAPLNRQLIAVRHLCTVTRTALSALNDGGHDDRRKNYSALILSNRPLDESRVRACVDAFKFPIHVAQPTPIRVLHRRAVATRPRDVFALCITQWLSQHAFRIELETQAGAYVKEFVHGDLGRTRPSLTDLLRDCIAADHADHLSSKRLASEDASDSPAVPFELECAELDVINVQFEWPPYRSTSGK